MSAEKQSSSKTPSNQIRKTILSSFPADMTLFWYTLIWIHSYSDPVLPLLKWINCAATVLHACNVFIHCCWANFICASNKSAKIKNFSIFFFSKTISTNRHDKIVQMIFRVLDGECPLIEQSAVRHLPCSPLAYFVLVLLNWKIRFGFA